jgi:phosphatidylglycerophosphatase A
VASSLATWFGTGLLPGPTGTWGSLLAIPFAEVAWLFGQGWGLAAFAVAMSAAGVWSCTVVVRARQAEDPKETVIDEVAGQAFSLLGWHMAFPEATGLLAWAGVGGAFFLFRAIDIFKPGPVGKAEDLPEGWGVMADDILGGILVGLSFFVVRVFLPG